jgi:hypothetical protein
MANAADLSLLADIVEPPPASWWPPALGWWIVGAALLATLAIIGWACVRRYRRNAYRRAALAELRAIGAAADPAARATSVSAVLKRAALVAYPRATVASLTGSAWLAFLDSTGRTMDFSRGSAGFGNATMGATQGDGCAMLIAAKRWVRRHQAGT